MAKKTAPNLMSDYKSTLDFANNLCVVFFVVVSLKDSKWYILVKADYDNKTVKLAQTE
jgi:uncharacterized membrane protein